MIFSRDVQIRLPQHVGCTRCLLNLTVLTECNSCSNRLKNAWVGLLPIPFTVAVLILAFSLHLFPSTCPVSLSLSFSLPPTQRTPTLLGCEHWRSVVELLPVPWFTISADAPAVFPVLMKMGLMNCWEITITCVECFWKLVRVDTDNLIVVLFECPQHSKSSGVLHVEDKWGHCHQRLAKFCHK